MIAAATTPERSVDPFDEIELLTARNREVRRPGREQKLVRLRHRAFEQLDRVEGRPVWPPTYPDRFAGHDPADGPPEVRRAELDADLLGSALQNHGSLMVRGLLDPDQVELLAADIRQTFAARDRFADGATEEETSPWFVPFAPGHGRTQVFGTKSYIRSADSPRTLFDLVEVFSAIGLPDLITEYLGERPAMSANKFALRYVTGEGAGPDFHQDGSFLGEELRTVNLWLALSRCGGTCTERPGLDLLPCRTREILETGTEGAIFDWTISPSVVERTAGEVPIVRPAFEPGDALFFDELLVHRTGVSEGMTDGRLAVESWFFAPSHYPDGHTPIVI